MIWRIITGEYPPDPGGVSDYTRVIARGLAAAGDEVHVWTPERGRALVPERGITVHHIVGGYGPAGLMRLDKAIADAPRGATLLQYVPQALGWKGMNLAFCWWLRARSLAPIVMFHEVMFPISRAQPLHHNLLGHISRTMAAITARSASRIFVSTPVWSEVLRDKVGIDHASTWLPLPCTIPVILDEGGAAEVRSRYVPTGEILIGHLGSYPQSIADLLLRILPEIMEQSRNCSIILLGRNAEELRSALIERQPYLAERVHAPGFLSGDDLSRHIAACDVMLQPYPDGACARRTTLVAALAHARPIVTNVGAATESIWSATRAVALADSERALVSRVGEIVVNRALRDCYGAAARALYHDKFDLRHSIAILRSAGCASQ